MAKYRWVRDAPMSLMLSVGLLCFSVRVWKSCGLVPLTSVRSVNSPPPNVLKMEKADWVAANFINQGPVLKLRHMKTSLNCST